jgi:predicted amidohydrolase YtcJ
LTGSVRTRTALLDVSAADFLYRNGKIATVDGEFSIADGVAVLGGRVVGVGRGEELRGLVGRRTTVVDLGGRTVVPGFVDSHSHPYAKALGESKIDLRPCRSVQEILEKVELRSRELPPGEWVEAGVGWRTAWLAEQRMPTRKELDAVAPDNPVFLPHLGYTVMLNSAALAAAGIDRDTVAPGGGDILRDEAGEPTGEIVGIPAIRPVERLIPEPSLDARLAGLRFMCRQNLAMGKTSAIDAGVFPEGIRTYQEANQRGELTVRTSVMPRPDTTLPLPQVLESVRAWGVRTGFGDDMLKLSGIKMFLDGGIEGAHQREPYVGRPDYFGQVTTDPTVVREVAMLAAELGWDVGVHACGGAAMDTLLDIYEEVDARYPLKDRRFSLIHGFFPDERTFERCRRLNVPVAVQQTLLYNLATNFIAEWGAERVAMASPHRDYLDQGVMLGGGVDGTPFEILLAIWSCITRETRDEGIIGPGQRITREEALRMYTSGSAYVMHEETVKGALEIGKYGDMVVLDRDLLTCPVEEIKETSVIATIVGGEVRYGEVE